MPACEEHLLEEENYEISQELLNTIKLPRNLKHLNNRLPKSQYEENEIEKENCQGLNRELSPKLSQPVLGLNKSHDNLPKDPAREAAKYEAIAEIERKYGRKKSRTGKKQRQIPKTTPSSINGIPNIYNKCREEARDAAESLKKQNYLKLREKYSQRAKEVEKLEREKRMLRNQMVQDVANGASHNASYDYPRDSAQRPNYHDMRSGRKYDLISHMNSRSQDHREPLKRSVIKPLSIKKHNMRLPSTTKEMDNLSVNDNERRKARILRHAQEIRAAVSLNKERATGASSAIYNASGAYESSVPKWWG